MLISNIWANQATEVGEGGDLRNYSNCKQGIAFIQSKKLKYYKALYCKYNHRHRLRGGLGLEQLLGYATRG